MEYIKYSLQKEGNSDTCYNMDEPQGHYAQDKRTNTVGFHSHEVPREVRCMETERGRGREFGGRGALVLIGTEFQFGKMKSSGGGWWRRLHNSMNILNAIELCT